MRLDVKKLGRVPQGGGKRFAPGFAETRSGPRSNNPLGVEYLHLAVDDHSRYAYVEALPDEPGTTELLHIQVQQVTGRGVLVARDPAGDAVHAVETVEARALQHGIDGGAVGAGAKAPSPARGGERAMAVIEPATITYA